MTTKQSLPRQALRFLRFLIAIPLLRAAFAGEINGWVALFSYIGVWIVFLLVDGLMAPWRHSPEEYAKYTKETPRDLPYPLNQLPRADHRRR
jgi:hypothetical protein